MGEAWTRYLTASPEEKSFYRDQALDELRRECEEWIAQRGPEITKEVSEHFRRVVTRRGAFDDLPSKE